MIRISSFNQINWQTSDSETQQLNVMFFCSNKSKAQLCKCDDQERSSQHLLVVLPRLQQLTIFVNYTQIDLYTCTAIYRACQKYSCNHGSLNILKQLKQAIFLIVFRSFHFRVTTDHWKLSVVDCWHLASAKTKDI